MSGMLCLKFVVLIVVSNSDTDGYQLPPSSGSNNLQTLVSVHQSEWHCHRRCSTEPQEVSACHVAL